MEAEVMNMSTNAVDHALGGNGTGTALVAGNTAAVAVAEKARATVQARYAIALHRPRDWDRVRQLLLKDCLRPGFAEVARYAKPVGGKQLTGPSIRFVEAALRHMGNVANETQVTFEDDEKRIVNVSITDLETNTCYALDIIVSKTVERKQLKRGQQPLGTRTNSYGDTVYIVEAGEDELITKQAALVSKAVRTLGMRIIPGDLVEEAEKRVLDTLAKRDASDPDAARKAIVDAFFGVGVGVGQLKEYLGHPIEASAPHEIQALRDLYSAIRSGETTWVEVMENREEQREEKGKSKATNLRDRAKKTAEAAKTPADYIANASDADALYAVLGAAENRVWINANLDTVRDTLSAAIKRTGADPNRVEELLGVEG